MCGSPVRRNLSARAHQRQQCTSTERKASASTHSVQFKMDMIHDYRTLINKDTAELTYAFSIECALFFVNILYMVSRTKKKLWQKFRVRSFACYGSINVQKW